MGGGVGLGSMSFLAGCMGHKSQTSVNCTAQETHSQMDAITERIAIVVILILIYPRWGYEVK